MPLTNRPGLFAASESSRVYVTLVFVVSAFFEINTRPTVVAPQSVLVSPPARASAATFPPRRVEPYAGVGEGEGEGASEAVSVSSVAPGGPILTKSPQVGSAPE